MCVCLRIIFLSNSVPLGPKHFRLSLIDECSRDSAEQEKCDLKNLNAAAAEWSGRASGRGVHKCPRDCMCYVVSDDKPESWRLPTCSQRMITPRIVLLGYRKETVLGYLSLSVYVMYCWQELINHSSFEEKSALFV